MRCGTYVRAVLHRELRAWHPGGDTLFVDELDLGGVVRVDTAAINSALCGYEIKSARDTLRRLPQQVEVYSKVCDHAALLVAENHREHAAELPSWWAVYVVTGGPGVVELTPVAAGGPNPGVDPLATAQLLWRDEALAELADRGLDRGVRSKRRCSSGSASPGTSRSVNTRTWCASASSSVRDGEGPGDRTRGGVSLSP